MKYQTEKRNVPIHDIIPNEWNPNWMDAKTFEKEKASIKELGMLGSILVHEIVPGRYRILDGEHRWKACIELGRTEMPVEVILGEVSDQDVKLLTILLNNLRGKDDIFKRAAILKELDSGQISLLPMTEEEVENEKKLISFDFAQYEKEAELPERTPGMLVVLPLTVAEAEVWKKAKEQLVLRELVTKDNTKKRQDIQILMWMLKATLGLTVGSEGGNIIEFEAAK